MKGNFTYTAVKPFCRVQVEGVHRKLAEQIYDGAAPPSASSQPTGHSQTALMRGRRTECDAEVADIELAFPDRSL